MNSIKNPKKRVTLKNTLERVLPEKFYHRIRFYYRLYRQTNNPDSYLVKTGFVKSLKQLVPIDHNDDSLPWMNYPIIDFLEKRLNSDFEVFEFGSGFSTAFYAKKVKNIYSVEHDKDWYDKSKQILQDLPNVNLIFRTLNDEYPATIKSLNKLFDVVVIDGRKRVKSAITAMDYLNDSGVLILDDSDRAYYKPIWDLYLAKGFRELTFTGIKPTDYYSFSSTIFYRDNNCFNI